MAKIKALQEALQEKVEANAALQRSLTQSEARFEGVQVELQMKMKLLHRLQTVHNDINFKGNHPDAEYKHSSDTLTYHDLLLESQEDIFNLNNQRIILLEKIELMATSTGHHDKIEKEMEKLIDTKTQEMQQVRFEHQQLKQIIMKMEAELKATEELKMCVSLVIDKIISCNNFLSYSKNKALETELAFYMVKAQNIQKIAQPIPPPAPLPTSGYGNEAMARLMENVRLCFCFM